MKLVLSRIDYQGSRTPLYMRDRPGSGIVTIKEAPGSEKVVKVLAPWSLPVFKDFEVSDVGVQEDTDEASEDVVAFPLGSKIPEALFTTMEAARRRALEANDQQQASIFQTLLDSIDPSNSPEGSERNWPLVIKTLRERFPGVLREVSLFNPGTLERSSRKDLVFEESDFFLRGLGWLNLLVKDQVSPNGKECTSDAPLQVGKWLPNSVARMRRFYKHGSKEHVHIFPSAKAKVLLRQEVQDGYDSSPTYVSSSFFKSEAENISLLREVLSTIHNLHLILRSDT